MPNPARWLILISIGGVSIKSPSDQFTETLVVIEDSSSGPRSAVPLFVFAKLPRPGNVKTRLAATIGKARACMVAEALLRDTVRRFGDLPGTPMWLLGDRPDDAAFRDLLGEIPRYRPQSTGPLGARLRAAFRPGSPGGEAPGAIAIGADAPHLDPRQITSAAEGVRAGEAVLGPSEDGGFHLIALPCGPVDLEALFPDAGWGEPGVLERTRRAFRNLRLPWREIPPLRDVDEWRDLLHLARLLQEDAVLAAACPDTLAVARAVQGWDIVP